MSDQTELINAIKTAIQEGFASIKSSGPSDFGSLNTNTYPLTASLPYYSSSINQTDGTLIDAQYKLYDLQHLDWYEHKQLSQSIIPAKKQVIDTDLQNVNKIPFNNTNSGKEGAEPFNRLYTRKLFEYEIDIIRNPFTRGLYAPALYEIKPSANFENFSVTNFYSQPEGIYFFDEDYKSPIFKNRNTVANWNVENNEFITGATTWSYGNRYVYGDIVYQYVDKYSSFANEIGEATSSARVGNGRYYVFDQREQVREISGSVGYVLGSKIPSYLPPSLDQIRWKLLRFKPFIQKKPYRVVFDTTVFSDPRDNDYRTLQLNLDEIINEQTRYVDTFNIPSILGNSYVSGVFALQNIMALFAVQAIPGNIRLRLYRTENDATEDLNRSTTTDPAPNAGVLLDMTINNSNVTLTNPSPLLIAGGNPPGGKIYYTINNLSSSSVGSSTISLYYFAVEVQNRIPLGYLREHYRFFRDNSTATKRRNWLGCKNTDQTTADGLPVVQVTIKEGTQLNVSTALQDNEITLGGGGTLEA